MGLYKPWHVPLHRMFWHSPISWSAHIQDQICRIRSLGEGNNRSTHSVHLVHLPKLSPQKNTLTSSWSAWVTRRRMLCGSIMFLLSMNILGQGLKVTGAPTPAVLGWRNAQGSLNRDQREKWIAEKYLKKTFTNPDELAHFEAFRSELNSSSTPPVFHPKKLHRPFTWRPWQGVVFNDHHLFGITCSLIQVCHRRKERSLCIVKVIST